ncbi:MAG TPA: AAA family ATPase [Blastocatellia bacterium]
MITQVTIRRFKRFDEVTFTLPGHIVLAGPNNTGKTTVLQAIASWGLALNRWRQLNDYQRHGGGYTKAPIARQAFSAVPQRSYELLWNERQYSASMEVQVKSRDWSLTMEFIADTSEQIFVRPTKATEPGVIKTIDLPTVFIPPMTGLSTDEPVYQRPKVDQLLGQGRPGEIIRNLLVEAHQSETAWRALTASVKRLFGVEIMPPDATGADIIAEYTRDNGPRLDVASAGSGFQQVLMLLTFLYARPASVLLIDEPDAHLHIILQDTIYGELRSVAVKQNSQLIIATHSEVIINSVEPRELCILFDKPRMVADAAERTRVARSLGILSDTDIMLALVCPGVLYLEGHTDLDILREWARILGHKAQELFSTKLFWRPTIWETRTGAQGIKSTDHFAALQLVREDVPGLMLLDRDEDARKPDGEITGKGLQRLRWRRYEIESYLVHPDAIDRFIDHQTGGPELSAEYKRDARKYFEQQMPAVLSDPLGEHLILEGVKASDRIIPAILAAAGIHGVEKDQYYEIAALMKPEEIHPEVTEKLDAILRAFRL